MGVDVRIDAELDARCHSQSLQSLALRSHLARSSAIGHDHELGRRDEPHDAQLRLRALEDVDPQRVLGEALRLGGGALPLVVPSRARVDLEEAAVLREGRGTSVGQKRPPLELQASTGRVARTWAPAASRTSEPSIHVPLGVCSVWRELATAS